MPITQRFFTRRSCRLNNIQCSVVFASPFLSWLESRAIAREYVLFSRLKSRYEGRSAWNKEPIKEERWTTNQEAWLECVHSFSRVWRNKGRSGSPRSFARHSEKAGSQPKKSCYCAPPYYRLPVFGQSLLNSQRSPPSGTTPSLQCYTSNNRNVHGPPDHARAFLTIDISYHAVSRLAQSERKMVADEWWWIRLDLLNSFGHDTWDNNATVLHCILFHLRKTLCENSPLYMQQDRKWKEFQIIIKFRPT